MKPLLLAALLLASCTRRYQVCWRGPDDIYCGTPMSKEKAELAVKYGNRPEHGRYEVMASDGVSGLHYRSEKTK